jgi:hypothetical protein
MKIIHRFDFFCYKNYEPIVSSHTPSLLLSFVAKFNKISDESKRELLQYMF